MQASSLRRPSKLALLATPVALRPMLCWLWNDEFRKWQEVVVANCQRFTTGIGKQLKKKKECQDN